MKLQCLIIDDKPLAVDLLADYTSKVPFLELTATTNDPIAGLEILRNNAVDLVFLDIQMPQLNGLEFISAAPADLKVILTTAYNDYAIEGYEHDVIDYLLKPISFERFYRAATKALKAHEQTAAASPATYFFVKSASKLQKVNFADISYVQGLQNYVVIHTEQERTMSLQPLKRIEEQLPGERFIRVHKSYIVSINAISYIGRSKIHLLKPESVIPIGETYKDVVRDLIRL
jgi:two-component system LytT family response regulator